MLDALLSEHQPLSSSAPPLIAPGVECSDIAGQGRGLIATQTLRQGQTVLSIPLEAAITPEKAAQMSSLRDFISREPTTMAAASAASDLIKATLPDWTLLAVWLAELIYTQTSSSNFSSNRAMHAAYAAVLPTTTNCILEWTDEEVGWLRGSYLHTLALDIRTAAQTSWKELEPIVHHAERAGLIPQGVLTEISVHHAFALLLSRLIRITNSTGADVEVLCPWADFINHDSTCSSFLQLDQKNERIVLVADRTYCPGDQIVASYGQKTSGELLLSYGFMPEEGLNPHDACLISVEIEYGENSTEKSGGKGEKQDEKLCRRVFPLKMGAVPDGLFDALCNNSSSSNAEQLLVDLCKRKLEMYTISLDDAKTELSVMTSDSAGDARGGGTSKKKVDKTFNKERREAVLRILVQEQKILARTIFLMKQQLKQAPRR